MNITEAQWEFEESKISSPSRHKAHNKHIITLDNVEILLHIIDWDKYLSLFVSSELH